MEHSEIIISMYRFAINLVVSLTVLFALCDVVVVSESDAMTMRRDESESGPRPPSSVHVYVPSSLNTTLLMVNVCSVWLFMHSYFSDTSSLTVFPEHIAICLLEPLLKNSQCTPYWSGSSVVQVICTCPPTTAVKFSLCSLTSTEAKPAQYHRSRDYSTRKDWG